MHGWACSLHKLFIGMKMSLKRLG